MSRDRERFDEIGRKIKADASSSISSSSLSDNQLQQMGIGIGIGVGRRHVLGPPGSLNTITPCAACKLLRRRCAEECPFSPYFSPHEPQKFVAVHKVFGASNVSKMLMEVPESQRADAANSLVYEANLRLRDPVYGCMGAIVALQQQMQALHAELNAVRAEILKYKLKYSELHTPISCTAAPNNIINTSINDSNNINSHNIPAVAAAAAANSSTQHAALLIPTGVGVGAVSIAVAPPSPVLIPSTPPPPPPPSIVVSSTTCSSSASSLYTPPPNTSTSTAEAAAYTSITTDHNVPYFD